MSRISRYMLTARIYTAREGDGTEPVDPNHSRARSVLSERRILPNALLGSHAVKLFGYVETQQKGSWIKDHSLSDREGAARSIDFDWLCATPGTIGLTMKSIEKFSFGHHGSRSYSQSRRHANTREA